MNNQPPPLPSQPPPLPYRQNRQSSSLGEACLGVAATFVGACALIIFAVFGGGGSKPSSENPSREEVAKSHKGRRSRPPDSLERQDRRGRARPRNERDISFWNQSVDLTIGSRSAKVKYNTQNFVFTRELGLVLIAWVGVGVGPARILLRPRTPGRPSLPV